MILAYLVGWSFVGDGQRSRSPTARCNPSRNGATRLRSLDTATMDEIVEALAPHHPRESAGGRGKKNDPGTRARIMTTLALCKIMGMSYDEIRALAASRV